MGLSSVKKSIHGAMTAVLSLLNSGGRGHAYKVPSHVYNILG